MLQLLLFFVVCECGDRGGKWSLCDVVGGEGYSSCHYKTFKCPGTALNSTKKSFIYSLSYKVKYLFFYECLSFHICYQITNYVHGSVLVASNCCPWFLYRLFCALLCLVTHNIMLGGPPQPVLCLPDLRHIIFTSQTSCTIFTYNVYISMNTLCARRKECVEEGEPICLHMLRSAVVHVLLPADMCYQQPACV